MGYDFSIKGYYKVKAEKEYPWPCAALPDRTLTIYPEDILALQENGKFMKHTGLGTMNHIIPMEDVERFDDEAKLRLL